MLRRQEEQQRDVRLAWMTVNLGAATWAKGRVPDLQTLLTPARAAATPQTVDEQRAILQVLAQRLGRPLRQTKGTHGR